MSDEEIAAFVASTMDLHTGAFLVEVAKLVRANSKGWTLKAAAQMVRRVAKEHGWEPKPALPEEVSL